MIYNFWIKSTSNGNEGEQHEGEQHEGEQHEGEQHEREQHECILLHKEDSPSKNWEITLRVSIEDGKYLHQTNMLFEDGWETVANRIGFGRKQWLFCQYLCGGNDVSLNYVGINWI